jgi:UMF1 family MFS transporter
MRSPAARPLSVAGWVLYDLANTVFAMGVLTLHFPEYVRDDLGAAAHAEWYIGLANAASGVLLLIALPALGAAADRFRNRRPFVVFFTLLCIATTAALGLPVGLLGVLAISVVARFAYQCALVLYEPMLADVSGDPRRMPWISGLGTGMGYFGSFVALFGVAFVLSRATGLAVSAVRAQAFPVIAAFFLAGALPFFLWTRDADPAPATLARLLRAALVHTRALARTWTAARAHSAFLRYLLAAFLFLDGVHTVFMYMALVLTDFYDVTEAQKNAVLFAGITAAIPGSLIIGLAARRWGSGRVLRLVLAMWIVTLSLALAVRDVRVLWVLGPCVGVALGGTWTACRPVVILLAPAERATEFYALYGVVSKASLIAGPLLWGAIKRIGLGTDVAIAATAMLILAGLALLPREAR